MKHNRIGLLKAALEAVSETPANEDGALEVPPTAEQEAVVATDVAPVAQIADAAPEVPAGGNQDETPAAGTDDAPVNPPPEATKALAENAAEAELEQEQEAPLDPDAPELEVGEVDMIELFADVSDLRADSSDLNANAEELRKASLAVAELEDLADAAETTGAVDADTEAGRVLLEVAVEGIYSRLGIDNPVIALEDGAGMGASVGAKVSSIREQVVRLLRTIVEAIKRAYAKAVEYLKRIFEVASQVEKGAIAVRSRVRKISDNGTFDEKLKNERLKNALGVPKDVMLVRAFKNMFELVDEAYKSANSGYIDYLNTLIDQFVQDKDVSRLIADFPRVLARSLDNRFTHNSSNAEFDVRNAGDKVEILTSDLMPGCHVGVLLLPKTVADLREFEYNVVRTDDGEAEDLYILDRTELLWLTEAIITTTSVIRKYERDVKANGTLVNKLTAAIANLEEKGDVDITAEDREFLKSVAAMAPALARGIHERTFAFAVSTCAAAVRYADACVSKYESKAA